MLVVNSEKRKAQKREASKRYYWKNREKCLASNYEWRNSIHGKEVIAKYEEARKPHILARKRTYNNTIAWPKWKRVREQNKYILWEFLATHACVDCGEDDPMVLDFDHVRGEKAFPISRACRYTRQAVLDEIAKCEIRCSNCHRRKTAKESFPHKAEFFTSLRNGGASGQQ